jgi:hypothetical protein
VHPIVEWRLEQWDSQALTSIFRFAVRDRQGYLINMLARIATRAVEQLWTYAAAPMPGSSAMWGDQATNWRVWP